MFDAQQSIRKTFDKIQKRWLLLKSLQKGENITTKPK